MLAEADAHGNPHFLAATLRSRTGTRWYGHEGDILRYVFFHSIALAALVGLLVFLQAYVFTSMLVR